MSGNGSGFGGFLRANFVAGGGVDVDRANGCKDFHSSLSRICGGKRCPGRELGGVACSMNKSVGFNGLDFRNNTVCGGHFCPGKRKTNCNNNKCVCGLLM